MQSYRQYCPVAKAHAILGDRWTMLIVRELVLGHDGFNDIARGLPGIPRSTLSNRLQRLEACKIVARAPGQRGPACRYELTEAGRELKAVVTALGRWGAIWAFQEPDEEDLDPGLLLWRMRHRLNTEALPDGRVTVAFDFRLGPKGRFWLVIDAGAASVCVSDPGFEVALQVTADLSDFYQVWLGRMSLRHAETHGLLRIDGGSAHPEALGTWFRWSPMAEFVPTVLT
ncbi:winged helix-turn-helix transcriptional regulator [Thalassobaculum sp.]|uniref:winged helix-turn-helix transcriptional regulator n=1 Tax=Thalassobaculum sp. TaxID=2022740 RepID=UPI0032EBE694